MTVDVSGLVQEPLTWIVVAVALFVLALLLLAVGSRARRRRESAAAARRSAPATPAASSAQDWGPADDDLRAEPTVPAPAGPPPDGPPSDGSPPDGPADPAPAGPDPTAPIPAVRGWTPPAPAPAPSPVMFSATERLLAALVEDPWAALHAVAGLTRGDDRGRVASALLRSGVPVAATARLCEVAPDDLGVLVATSLGVMPPAPGPASSGTVSDAAAPATTG